MANVLYCRNGHFNGFVPEPDPRYRYLGAFHDWQERKLREELARLAFCPKCGVDNINVCLHCEITIEGNEECSSERPSYCCACGKPFPWTEIALTCAREYTDELEELTAEEKEALKATFDDLTVETARTGLAVSRFQKLLRKISPGVGDTLKKIITDVAVEAVRKSMGV
jgi:hypothetical protein